MERMMRAATAGWALLNARHSGQISLQSPAVQRPFSASMTGMLAVLALAFSTQAVLAQSTASTSTTVPLASLGSGKEPIKIDADRLDVFDTEKRATFTGNVVAVQGDTTIRCSALNVFYEQSATAASGQNAASSGDKAEEDNNIRKLDCQGPVAVVSKDQTATGQHALFDRDSNTVTITGNVALSQEKNVQQCDRVIYNLNSSVANCIAKPGGRVQGVFVPGSNNPAAKPK